MSPGPHCKAPDACKASPKAIHCKACTTSARWADPAFKQKVGAKLRGKRPSYPPFRDELKVRRAVLLASAFGLRRAAEMMKVHKTSISRWRRRLEERETKRYERLPPPPPKLSLAKAREIRALLAAGEKGEYIAAVYGVSIAAVSKIKHGQLYPEPSAPDSDQVAA